MEWKLVAFDFNGTLFDDLEAPVYGSVKEIFKTHNLPAPSLETYRSEITENWIAFYRKYGILNASPEELNDIRARYFEEHGDEGNLHFGAAKMLQTCKSYNIERVIVSAEKDDILQKRVVDLGIKKYFARVVGNARDKTKSLLETCADLDVAPEAAVYVDDSFSGITAAKQAGLTTIGFLNGYAPQWRIRQAKPDYEAGTMLEVEGIIVTKILLQRWRP